MRSMVEGRAAKRSAVQRSCHPRFAAAPPSATRPPPLQMQGRRVVRFTTPAIILSLRSHGEHGAVVRMMTPDHGLQAAYVRGARGRRMRPVVMAGNLVEARLAARTEGQLPHGRARTDPQPRAAARRALACRGDRLGDRPHRHRAARRPALSAAPRGARRIARGGRGGPGGERVGRGDGALRTVAAGRTRLRPRPRNMRGQRVTRRSGRGQSALGAGGEPGGGGGTMRCCRSRRSSVPAGRRALAISSTGCG